jgi:membrane protease YdiL (CAAX protease family)
MNPGFHVNAWIVVLAYAGLVAAGLLVDFGLVIRLATRPFNWPLHAFRLQTRPWTAREALPLIGLLMVLYAMASILRPAAPPATTGPAELDREALWMTAQGAVFQFAGLAFVAFTLARRRIPWSWAFGAGTPGLAKRAGYGVVFYLAMLPSLAFYAALYQGALRYYGFNPLPQDVVLVFAAERSIGLRAALGAMAVVLAPAFEEILFRGIALPLFARRWGVAPAVTFVSIVFASIHFHLPSFLPMFVVAVAFSLAYIQSESIVVPVVMHGLFNGVNLLLLVLLQ